MILIQCTFQKSNALKSFIDNISSSLGLEDVDYQSSLDTVKANWHGFYDSGSGVRRYHWCIGSTPDVVTCDVMAWSDVGLATQYSATLVTPAALGKPHNAKSIFW